MDQLKKIYKQTNKQTTPNLLTLLPLGTNNNNPNLNLNLNSKRNDYFEHKSCHTYRIFSPYFLICI